MAGRDNPDGISSAGNGTVYNRMCTKWRHEKGSPDTKGFPGKKIEQVMGIEPTYLAWKASVLPLNYTCICPEPESNQRHEDFQSSALPTELSGRPVSGTDNANILTINRPFVNIFSQNNLIYFLGQILDNYRIFPLNSGRWHILEVAERWRYG